jgi:site-specific DNA-methyltransferase (adenine-specific)
MSRIETIGDATLYLGDCREILPTLAAVDHVITDPPYEKEAHRTDRRVMRRDGLVAGALTFAQMDEMTRLQVTAQMARIGQGWVLVFCQAEGVAPWRDAIEAAGAKYKAPMVWIKPDGMPQFNGQGPGMGFESMVAAWSGQGRSRWNGGGRHGVFTFPKGEGAVGKNEHETQKPVRLMRELVGLFSNPGESILDPFMGSGTTGVAAIRLGRKFVGIEQEPRYFEVACRRLAEAEKQPDMFNEIEKRADRIQAALELPVPPEAIAAE